MTTIIDELARLRETVRGWKRGGGRIAFVPTMGNLHAGHFSLVSLARERADHVVASVFVNPTQFGPQDDFARYPRTPQHDADGLSEAGCDVLWMPSVDTMYPFGASNAVRVQVPGVTDVLEGAHRPGHFDGVATVVARLFLQVQPDVAVFGRKDYQQLAVISYLVEEMSFPVAIVPGPTVREPDGLAMSSRNQYLSPSERAVATEIHSTLQSMRAAVESGDALADVETAAERRLNEAGFDVDYAAIRRRDLRGAGDQDSQLVALIAAKLGRTRLIDNLEFERHARG
ncbi:pantoate--beta-alanine ligase [Cognatilysobacter lacus]|uniref:Pantothenate synthetase n=1 Tax=Cognatilysobacter lacus TaxID=1643323 RepID=A0A5D8Z705_9GAMM|nr:pantoate--beta-alanine ligase [Lysobacter lacus]TZF90569.1 pantoate--beta-alanine ligase [Lysobacter lacus]